LNATMQQPVKLQDTDINNIASLVLGAIYAGLDSDIGAQKIDRNLGRKWEKDAKTRGEL
jgi:hypothetical protein